MIGIMLGLPNGLLSLRWPARTAASGVPGLERRGAPP
jgi:hypothetical protein